MQPQSVSLLRRATSLAFVIFGSITLSFSYVASYGQETAAVSTLEKDSIQIISISHTQPSEADHSCTILVDVMYHLASKLQGQLLIGFNTENSGSFRMLDDLATLVEPGTGYHSFEATITATQWDGEESFSVYVNLSEHPHPKRWRPLANDRKSLPLVP
ncbi:MAG: hypothetical protein ACFB15_10335 [Cyclobacteriaceae bacterium]